MHNFHGSAVQTGWSNDGFFLLHHVLVFSWEGSLVGSDLIASRWDHDFPGGPAAKNLPANAGNTGSVPHSERSPGGGNGNPLQYSCLGDPMDRGACWLQSIGSQRVRCDLAAKQWRVSGGWCQLLAETLSEAFTSQGLHRNRTSIWYQPCDYSDWKVPEFTFCSLETQENTGVIQFEPRVIISVWRPEKVR